LYRAFTDADQPVDCPKCGERAKRIIDFSSVTVATPERGGGPNVLRESCNRWVEAAKAVGRPTPSARALEKTYGKRQESIRKAGRVAKTQSGRSMALRASIPAHVFHANREKYHGDSGLKQAEKDGFGV